MNTYISEQKTLRRSFEEPSAISHAVLTAPTTMRHASEQHERHTPSRHRGSEQKARVIRLQPTYRKLNPISMLRPTLFCTLEARKGTTSSAAGRARGCNLSGTHTGPEPLPRFLGTCGNQYSSGMLQLRFGRAPGN